MAKAEDIEFWIEQLARLDPGWPEWSELRSFVENAPWRTGEVYWGRKVETIVAWHDDRFLTREPRRSAAALSEAEEWFAATPGLESWLGRARRSQLRREHRWRDGAVLGCIRFDRIQARTGDSFVTIRLR